MFVVGGLYSLANGVAWIMRDLAAALSRAGTPVDVYGAECWGRGAKSIGHIFEPPCRWISAKGLWLGGLSWSPGIRSRIRSGVQQSDVVHNHSVWMLPNSYASRAAESSGKPVVVTAHGTLERWALQNSSWKKQLAGVWFQNRDLQHASCIHVNSVAEIAGIREYGLRQPIAVIPNGVNLHDLADNGSASQFHNQFPETRGKKILLFMARLHAKKGLGHLLPAWGKVARRFSDWQLVIAGPDCGYEGEARRLVDTFHIGHSVTFTGNLQGEMKRSALRAANAFILPSFSEGFSMAIMEAMAAGLPVLMTPGCNFHEAVQAGAALQYPANIEGTQQGLELLLAHPERKLEEMGQRGKNLIASEYTWDHVASKTLKLYAWLTGKMPRPDFIISE